MLNQPTETYLAWAAALLLLGGVLAVAGGALTLAGARKRPYFQLRRPMPCMFRWADSACLVNHPTTESRDYSTQRLKDRNGHEAAIASASPLC